MNKQEVDTIYAEALEACCRRAREIGRAQLVVPHLGGDVHLIAPNAGSAQPLARLLRVVVGGGRVYMAIAELQRRAHHLDAGAPAQIPRAETDDGDACAAC